MKKSSIIKICAAFLSIIIISILVVLLRPRDEIVPHYKFLDGNGTLIKAEENDRRISKVKEIFYACSFAADFNDIYEKADNELSGLGFVLSEYPFSPPSKREYGWYHPESNESVIILENHDLGIYNDEKGPEKLKPNHEFRKGWNTVIVVQEQKKNWLVYHFDLLLNKLRNKRK